PLSVWQVLAVRFDTLKRCEIADEGRITWALRDVGYRAFRAQTPRAWTGIACRYRCPSERRGGRPNCLAYIRSRRASHRDAARKSTGLSGCQIGCPVGRADLDTR